MVALPWLRPLKPEGVNKGQTALEREMPASSRVVSFQSEDPFVEDLNAIDESLANSNAAIAARAGEVARAEETAKLLKSMVDLEEKEQKARLEIHHTLAKHKQFQAGLSAQLQAINQAHLLAMAGHHGTAERQKAEYLGIAAARAAIAARMRGGAA
ncbi:MAG: hypothetical protein IGS50_12465 [Synechococcales cyanobacterium C42_A2020_086]|jgi:hypothetical protein|nr:hypothetical protein [Synechococcales cyanobacterium C42_A2020_086]